MTPRNWSIACSCSPRSSSRVSTSMFGKSSRNSAAAARARGVDLHAARHGGVGAVVEVGLGEPLPEQRAATRERRSAEQVVTARRSRRRARPHRRSGNSERHGSPQRQAVELRFFGEDEHPVVAEVGDAPARICRSNASSSPVPLTATTRSSSSPAVVTGRTDPNRKPTASRPRAARPCARRPRARTR